MIALQSLKYKIFEWCLDTFADKLIANFRTNANGYGYGLTNIALDDLRVGMLIAEIWIIIDSRGYKGIWKGCKVEDIVYWDPEQTITKEVFFTWSSHEDNINSIVEYPPLKEATIQGLTIIQSYEQNIRGINPQGITPEFFI